MKTTLTSLLFLFFALAMYGQNDNPDDYTALRDIYLNSGGDDWTDNTGWPDSLTFEANVTPPAGTDMSSWYGITVVSGRVTGIDLSDNNLEGPLSDAFGLMTELVDLDFSSNNLWGCLSDDILVAVCNGQGSFLNNPQMPYQGDYSGVCGAGTIMQVGAPCDDGNDISGDDTIQTDCSCEGIIDPCDPDLLAPEFTCSDKTIALISSPLEMEVSVLISNLSDNCDTAPVVEGRRLDPGNGPDDNWSSTVVFECSDFPSVVLEVRVTDAAGNAQFCELDVTNQEGINPVIEEELSDITIGCHYIYDENDLSEFGTYVYEESDREEIIITEGSTETSFGFDGLVVDICPGGVTTTSATFLNDCGIGYIERYFVITDIKGAEVLDTQRIDIVLNDIFDVENDIEWPEMYVYDGCHGTAPLPSESGEPEILRFGCSMLTLPEYTDMEFVHPGGGCNKIIRTWTVLDWCIHDGNTGEGRYTYEQIIKINDDEDPTFDGTTCDPFIGEVFSNSCDLNVDLTAEGSDNCTTIEDIHFSYELDIDADGTVDEIGDGPNYIGTLPIGDHNIRWILNDNCGNVVNCVKDISIVDGKAPSLTCIDGLVITINRMFDEDGNPVNMAMLDAGNLIKESTDFCTDDSTIKFSFSPDVDDTLAIYGCDDVGVKFVDIYATDVYGNSDFCTTRVTIQDNGTWCPESDGFVSIGGKVSTESGVAMEGARVRLQAAESHVDFMSDAEGGYLFTDVSMHEDYEINVDYGMSAREGVSVVDLVKVQRHILGLDLLDSPYKMIAADVDGSKSINPLDLLDMRKVLLNIKPEFEVGYSWSFIDKSADMAEDSNPWPINDKLTFTDLSTNVSNGDFVAVKVGDVNGSMDGLMQDGNSVTRNESIPFSYEVHDGSRAEIAIDDNMKLNGIQFTIPLDETSRIFQITSSVLDINVENYHIEDDYVTFMWYSTEAVSVNKGQILLAVNGKNLENIQITSEVTEAELYDEKLVKYDIGLKAKYENAGFSLSQNTPNPFLNETTVEIEVPYAGNVTTTISDQNGKVLVKNVDHYEKGLHQLNIGKGLGNHTGVLILQAAMDDKIEMIKMIKFK